MRNLKVFQSIFQSSKLLRSVHTNAAKTQSDAVNSNLGNEDETTHFGFKTIKASEKAKQGNFDFAFLIITNKG